LRHGHSRGVPSAARDLVDDVLRVEVEIRFEEVADGAGYGVDRARLGLAQQGFELGENLLDGIEVWRVGRQEEEPGACSPDRRADRAALVSAEVVHDDDVTFPERRNQELLDVTPEGLAVDRAVDDAGRFDPIMPKRGKERHRAPVAVRNVSPQRGAATPPAMRPGHVRLRQQTKPDQEQRIEASQLERVRTLMPGIRGR